MGYLSDSVTILKKKYHLYRLKSKSFQVRFRPEFTVSTSGNGFRVIFQLICLKTTRQRGIKKVLCLNGLWHSVGEPQCTTHIPH